jgi:type VI secretion system secreted protein Hcp
MAFRCVIKLDGIEGTSELKKGFIDVLSYNWGVANDVKAWEKAPAGTARVNDFSFVKRVDPSSPDIFTACANGKKIAKVEVSLQQAAGNDTPREFANYTFETCYITSVHPGGGSGGDGAFPTEQVSINFAKASYGYGSKKGAIDVGKGGIQGQ